MEAERDGYRQQLSVAEKRLDRVQSGVVNGLHSKPLNGEVKLELRIPRDEHVHRASYDAHPLLAPSSSHTGTPGRAHGGRHPPTKLTVKVATSSMV